jgi:hypothetical protein
MTTAGEIQRRILVTRGSEVQLKPLVWWLAGMILRAAITLLGGREGQGKSTIAAAWAAQESHNGGTVLWVGSEEPREQAIAPRLVAAGADMDRVIFVDVDTDTGTGALVFPLDLQRIEKTIQEHGVTMLVLDPAKGVMESGVSGNDDIAIRQYLEPIAAMAARRDIVVIALVHFGKREGTDSGKLILGSIAWSQVARSVLTVAEDPDTGHRVITNTKANYTPDDRSIECRFVSKTVMTEGGESVIGCAEFIGDTTKDARDYLGGHDDTTNEVDEWLNAFLDRGPQKALDVYAAADANGYSKDQAKRAKKRLGVEAHRPGGEGPWLWVKPGLGSANLGSTPSHVGVLPSPVAAPLQVREGAEDPILGDSEAREQSARECPLAPPSSESPRRCCNCSTELLPENDTDLCAECRFIARQEAVAQQISALDGEAS